MSFRSNVVSIKCHSISCCSTPPHSVSLNVAIAVQSRGKGSIAPQDAKKLEKIRIFQALKINHLGRIRWKPIVFPSFSITRSDEDKKVFTVNLCDIWASPYNVVKS